MERLQYPQRPRNPSQLNTGTRCKGGSVVLQWAHIERPVTARRNEPLSAHTMRKLPSEAPRRKTTSSKNILQAQRFLHVVYRKRIERDVGFDSARDCAGRCRH